MVDTLVRDMTADASPTGDDLIYVVNDPAGTPGNRKVTLTNLLGFVEANISGLATSVITSGTFADARIAQTNVTQHQAALSITESQISDLGTYLTDIVSDTTPQLGGSLDVNGNSIVSVSNGNITLAPNGTGNVILGNYTLDADATVGAGQDNYVLTYDHSSGTWGPEAATGGGGGAFTADGNSLISPTTSPTLDQATGDEVAFTLDYTVNKATSGNDTGLLVNMTDTASPGTSLLMDLQVGGTSKFSINNAGRLNLRGVGDSSSTSVATHLTWGSSGGDQGWSINGNEAKLISAGANPLKIGWAHGLTLAAGQQIQWTNNSFAASGPVTNDLQLWRDSADSLAQRRATNAQTFRIYNTYTDASNYERAALTWDTNVFKITGEAAGTGTVRNVAIGNYVFDVDQTVGASQDNYVLSYDNGTGLVSLESIGTLTFSLPASDTLSVTGTDSTVALDLGLTWNTTGNPVGLNIDVTNTASGDESLLISAKTSDSTNHWFAVGKAESADPFGRGSSLGTGTSGNMYYGTYDGYWVSDNNVTGFRMNNAWKFFVTGFNGALALKFGFFTNAFSGSATVAGTSDTYIERDDAYIINQRNGSNAQSFRITNTWTDASNNEFMKIGWNSNVLELGPVANGTGTLRGMKVGVTSSALLGFFGATPVAQQSTTGTTTGFSAGFGTSANDDSTYTGNTGSAAYTVGDIVRALKNLGLLAS